MKIIVIIYMMMLACRSPQKFSYEVLQSESEITKFSKNTVHEPDKVIEIEIEKRKSGFETSVYIYAPVGGCAPYEIEPVFNLRKDSVILSYYLIEKDVAEACGLLNLLKLNYSIDRDDVKAVFFNSPSRKDLIRR